MGSQLQQGSPGASQLGLIGFEATEQRAEVVRYLEAVRNVLPELELDSAAQGRLRSDLDVLQREMTEDSPRPVLVRELMHSVRATLEGAMGSAAGMGIVAGVTALWPHFLH